MDRQKINFTETIVSQASAAYLQGAFPFAEIEPILDTMNEIGLYAVEVMDSEQFAACLHQRKEDPWIRLKKLRTKLPDTHLQMRISGQRALASEAVPENVVRRYVRAAVRNGIDVVSVYDENNNLDCMCAAIEEAAHENVTVHAEINLAKADREQCPTLARELKTMGTTLICLSDPKGIVGPARVAEAVRDIRKELALSVGVRCSCAAGAAYMSYIMAAEAGASLLETTISPFSAGASFPATETLFCALKEFGYPMGLQEAKIYQMAEFFKNVRGKYLDAHVIKPEDMAIDATALFVKEKRSVSSIGNASDLLPFDLYQRAKYELGELADSEENVLSYLAVPDKSEDFITRRRNHAVYAIERIA